MINHGHQMLLALAVVLILVVTVLALISGLD
jgi:hypothetical protein